MTDLPDSESIRVLLIEDDPDYAKLIQRDLSSSRTSSFDTAHVSLLERGLELLAGASFDVGILDLNLPDSTGVDTVARVHAAAPDMAIVVLSASDETAVIQDVLLEGAQEFITKQPTAENLLVRSIRYAIDRLKAEKKQIRMIKGLKAVVDAAAELIQCPDVDTTLRRSVELAREKLGIERCAIFLDAGNNRVRGTYGTNCLGETTDERSYDAEMAAACEKQPLDQRPQGALWFASECAHTDWNGKEPVPIGKGWVVDSPILSSTGKPIASFTNDTAISGSPIDPVTQNILAVYCSHLGPLIESKRAEEARRESEQQLLQAQKMEAVGRLAGGIAHDFNNLLMIILNNASFVKDTLPSNSSAYADINEVVAAGRRASDLTQQLLAYSSRQMLARKVVDLNSVLTGTEHMLKRIIGEDIELTFVPTEDEAIVEVDSGQIEQVLLNLVVNARDAMPDGGRIVVQIENVSLFPEDVHHFVAATGKPEGEYVVFSVSDTGAGMSEVEREQIFEPFFTTKSVDKGTGRRKMICLLSSLIGQSFPENCCSSISGFLFVPDATSGVLA